MDLDQAIDKHDEWKTTFRNAISGRQVLDAETISKDHHCALGEWLNGEAKTKFAKHAALADCMAKHAAFHAEAGKVAWTINAKKFAEAEAMLNSDTPYATASDAVRLAISRLKEEAGL